MTSWFSRLFRRSAVPAMTCQEIVEVLQSYLDGETEAETAAAVARHLEVCGGCESEAEAYRSVINRLRAGQAHTVDQRVVSALEQFGRSLIDGGDQAVAGDL